MQSIPRLYRLGIVALLATFVMAGCATVDLYEKNVNIPGHQWASSYKPMMNFTITDTSSPYRVFLVLRHADRYGFNNIYVNLLIKGPGQDTVQKIQRDLLLGTNDRGWLAQGMGDIFEHRLLLTEQFLKAGNYQFGVEQLMREDPLKEVLNVGIRVEKIQAVDHARHQ